MECADQANAAGAQSGHGGSFYFGYGCMLCPDKMAEHCPNATLLGLGRVEGWKWQINSRGYANVVPADTESTPPAVAEGTVKAAPVYCEDTSSVYGLLYHLPKEDERQMDHYEKVTEGAYEKLYLHVGVAATTDPVQNSQSGGRDEEQERGKIGYTGETRNSHTRAPGHVGGPSRTAGPSRSSLPPGHFGGLPVKSPGTMDRHQISGFFGDPAIDSKSETHNEPKVPDLRTFLNPGLQRYRGAHKLQYSGPNQLPTHKTAVPPGEQLPLAPSSNDEPSSSTQKTSNSGHMTHPTHKTFVPGQRVQTVPAVAPGDKLMALVYVNEQQKEPEKVQRRYIQRINVGIEQATKLGMPRSYVENVLRKYVPGPGESEEVVKKYTK
ncbi:hypothetical protein MKZ38_003415 [Zalerion maritima]|uniref:gamma-glutamylcyclotransferase n=1 Tax=Zalerion maritima TaxID=339359 RepID=A0AAD5RMZ8_9PEZI|nr:hypothetical protein MKZ38_003415 [Zalerion maritima]